MSRLKKNALWTDRQIDRQTDGLTMPLIDFFRNYKVVTDGGAHSHIKLCFMTYKLSLTKIKLRNGANH